MKNNLNYLKNNLNLCGYTLLRVTNNKILIFKSFYKYTKCIYISCIDNHIEVKIDKVFDKVKPTSMKDMGLIMKELTPIFKGKADMKTVNEIVRSKLN